MATRSVNKSKAKTVLKYRKAGSEFRRLPFVGKTSWDVPQTGGYTGGCEMGKWAAIAFLKMLRASDYAGGFLQLIARDMIGPRSRENDSLAGQVVGFFSTLDSYMQKVAKRDGNLDDYSECDLAAAMTRAVNLDYAAWNAACDTIWKATGEFKYIPFDAYHRTAKETVST